MTLLEASGLGSDYITCAREHWARIGISFGWTDCSWVIEPPTSACLLGTN